jgi:hypothetical protein
MLDAVATRAAAQHHGQRQRHGAGQQPDRVDQDQRHAADREAVEQPERVAGDVEAQERERDVARGAPPQHPARLQQGRGARDEPVSRDDGAERRGDRIQHASDPTIGPWRPREAGVEIRWTPASSRRTASR